MSEISERFQSHTVQGKGLVPAFVSDVFIILGIQYTIDMNAYIQGMTFYNEGMTLCIQGITYI